MHSRLITAEARSQEFNKKQAELQALVHALEVEETGLLQMKRPFICSHLHSCTDRVNGSSDCQLDNHDDTLTSRLSTPSIAAPENSQSWTNAFLFLHPERTTRTLSSECATYLPPSVSRKVPTRNGYPPIFDAEQRSFHVYHSNSVIPDQPLRSSDR